MMQTRAAQGILIRTAQIDDATGIAEVRVTSWRATYQGMIKQETLDGLSVKETSVLIESSIRRNAPGSCRLVAQDASGRIAGWAGAHERSGI